MKKHMIVIALLIFSAGCATSYSRATRSTYIGNGVHEIRSNGNAYTSSDKVRDYMFRKAFETCAQENKGFAIQNQTETNRSALYSDGYGGLNTYHFPGGRMVIKCEGEVDTRLAAQFGQKDPEQ